MFCRNFILLNKYHVFFLVYNKLYSLLPFSNHFFKISIYTYTEKKYNQF